MFISLLLYIYSKLTAQRDTWANHVNVRNFWGVTEEQDYNPQCAYDTPENEQKSFLHTCWPKGSKREYRGWGWFCAQRRPGHALGYLQHVYHQEYDNDNNIPDMLIIVDDDTSVDINLALHQMSLEVVSSSSDDDKTTPYIGNPCMNDRGAGVGGSGTFFNRAAIVGLTQPIFCSNEQQQQQQQQGSSASMTSVCERLIAKTTIDTTLYQHGDSIFDIFYKYSAIREFCSHSDAAMAMMINSYAEITGGGLKQFGQCTGGRGMTCPTTGAITCHYQNPDDMKQFAIDRNLDIVIQPQPPKRSKSRLVLISGIFGISPLPPYFPMVLRSIQESGADGIIIGGDEREVRTILPPNIIHIPMTWDSLHDLISTKLFNGKTLPGFLAAGGYKVNDVKPLFGYLFQEILQGYEFWAHVDTDMIFGDVAGMLNPLMDSYDIISPANRGKNIRGCGYDDPIPVGETVPTIQCRLTRGYFMAYRNVPQINELFRLADADLYETLNTTVNIAIDEWGHGGGQGYPSSMSYVLHKFKYMDSEYDVRFSPNMAVPRVSLGLPFGWDGQDREDPDLNCIWSTNDGKSKLLANGIAEVLFCHFQFSKKIEARNKALWEMSGEDHDAILHSSSVLWSARDGISAVNHRRR
jgi:hypothetical protein